MCIPNCTRALLIFLLLSSGAVIAAAPKPSPSDTPITQARVYELERNYQQAADMYLLTAKKMPATSGEPWRVKAAEMAWMAGNSPLAETIVQGTDENQLNEAMTARYRLIAARIAQKAGDYPAVVKQLEIPTKNLSSSIKTQITGLLTNARRHAPDTQIGSSQLASNDIYWNNISTLSTDKLQQRLTKTESGTDKGWLELALLKRTYVGPELVTAVHRWERRYPGHPAQQTIATELSSKLTSSYSTTADQIAILLPRSGQYAGVTNVMIEGIFNAQNRVPIAQRPVIKIYDSAAYDIVSLYQQAVAEGAQLIIGPMDKKSVDQLTASTTTVPILTLNYGNKVSLFNPGLFQFALLPEDEAHSAAEKIASMEFTRVAVLAPDSHWGRRVAEAFKQQAFSLGVDVVAEGKFNPRNQDLSSVIQKTFKVNAKKANQHQVEVEVDAIFIAATPSQGRLLKPLLKFHFLGNVPVFSTSHIFSGAEDSSSDHDLNGIQFPEIPWLLKKGSLNAQNEKLPIFDDIEETAQQHPRLYAFGYDAFNLGTKLASGSATNLQLEGLSGNLYLDQRNRVHRLMGWAKFERGLPVAQSLPGSF